MSFRNHCRHAVIFFSAMIFFSFSVSAIDLNSSASMQYWSGDSLNFEVGTGGDLSMPGKANFTSTGIEFGQPLSIESSGPFSVGSGIELTDSSSNTIESYSTMYLTTSSGSPTDIVLDPTGDVGIDANLSISSGLIAGSGDISVGDGSGDIDMNGNRIYNGDLAHFNDAGIASSLTSAQDGLSSLSSNSLYVAGDIQAGGDFVGAGGDLAENIRTKEETLAPGTVATISGEMEVSASSERYDRGVAGVVSTDPGMILAKERDGVPLALSGIVPVNATVENGDIESGDLMTTSGEEGTAMKCQEVSRCQGAIIGKAMEPLNQDGQVEIIVTLG